MRRVGLVLVALTSAGIRARQAYSLLAFYLLEPESEDGLAQWSFYDNIVAPRSDFPVVRVAKPVMFRSHAVRN